MSPATKLVLQLLVNLADENGECQIGLDDIAERLGIARNTAMRTTQRLIRDGRIERLGWSSCSASRYRLVNVRVGR
jgi:DNA-binding IclR family transcriptional regulator